jgi:hypothetical protein
MLSLYPLTLWNEKVNKFLSFTKLKPAHVVIETSKKRCRVTKPVAYNWISCFDHQASTKWKDIFDFGGLMLIEMLVVL